MECRAGLRGTDKKSKDKCIGNEGSKFMEWVIEKGWVVLNGCTTGDLEGTYTYVDARGSIVIDYVLVKEHMFNKVCSFRIGDRIDSDHMPLELTLEGWRRRRLGKKIQMSEEKEKNELIGIVNCE